MATTTEETPISVNVYPITTVLLIGMRYCGKTILGKYLKSAFPPSSFVDIDAEIVIAYNRVNANITGKRSVESCGDIIRYEGWSVFRALENKLMTSFLEQPPAHQHMEENKYYTEDDGCDISIKVPFLRVISCGGGFVDYEPSVELVQRFAMKSSSKEIHHIIFIDRLLEDLLQSKAHEEKRECEEGLHSSRPAYTVVQVPGTRSAPIVESYEDVHRRRLPILKQLATFHFLVPVRESVDVTQEKISGVVERLLHGCGSVRFKKELIETRVRSLLMAGKVHAAPLLRNTHFITLSALDDEQRGNFHTLRTFLEKISIGCDALEIRLDLLLSSAVDHATKTLFDFNKECVLLVQAIMAAVPTLPLILTYRSVSEGGKGLDFTPENDVNISVPCNKPYWAVLIQDIWAHVYPETYAGKGRPSCPIEAVDIEFSSLNGCRCECENNVNLIGCEEDKSRAWRLRNWYFPSSSQPNELPFVILSYHNMAPIVKGKCDKDKRLAMFVEMSKELFRFVHCDLWTNSVEKENIIFKCSSFCPKIVCNGDVLDNPHFEPFLSLILPDVLRVRTAIPTFPAIQRHLFIGVCTGDNSKASRIDNWLLTPVTHPSLDAAGAPGQLSLQVLQSSRLILSPTAIYRTYCLFGTPISASKSPMIHNNIFDVIGKKIRADDNNSSATQGHGAHYGLFETTDVNKCFNKIISMSAQGLPSAPIHHHWGGSSVTIPLKEAVTDFLHGSPLGRCGSGMTGIISADAKAIGATNTLCPAHSISREDGGIIPLAVLGYNTDWFALRDAIKDRWKGQMMKANCVDYYKDRVFVVFGAGGTGRCAVFTSMTLLLKDPRNISSNSPCTICIVNRTEENALKLTDDMQRLFHSLKRCVRFIVVSLSATTLPDVHFPTSSTITYINTVPPGPAVGLLVKQFLKYVNNYETYDGTLLQSHHSAATVVDFAYTSPPNSESSLYTDKTFIECLRDAGLVASDVSGASNSIHSITSVSLVTGLELLERQALYQQRLWARGDEEMVLMRDFDMSRNNIARSGDEPINSPYFPKTFGILSFAIKY